MLEHVSNIFLICSVNKSSGAYVIALASAWPKITKGWIYSKFTIPKLWTIDTDLIDEDCVYKYSSAGRSLINMCVSPMDFALCVWITKSHGCDCAEDRPVRSDMALFSQRRPLSKIFGLSLSSLFVHHFHHIVHDYALWQSKYAV